MLFFTLGERGNGANAQKLDTPLGKIHRVNDDGSVPTDNPFVYYTPTFAPAGISFYTGVRYPGWKNTSLFVGGLLGQALRRLEINGRIVVSQEVLFNQFGRVRDIAEAPDGYD